MKRKIVKNRPLVSVVIPVFNGSDYLEETVRSVQASDFRNFEILLINDGSADKSKQICHSLEKKYANITFYSFQLNRGLGRVLNFALQKAKGTYICRINQDDTMFSHRMKTQVDYLSHHPKVVAVGSHTKLFRNNSPKYEIVQYLAEDEQIKKVWLFLSPFADPSVMYRKEVALKVGGYDQAFWPADDSQLWYKMGLVGRLANIQKPLVNVRFHDQAASVKHFRILTYKTLKMHLWIHKYVQKAPIPIMLFWFGQFCAGYLFTANQNWAMYRVMKKMVYVASVFRFFIQRAFPNPTKHKKQQKDMILTK